jgi:hypothetical protein
VSEAGLPKATLPVEQGIRKDAAAEGQQEMSDRHGSAEEGVAPPSATDVSVDDRGDNRK